jgi:DNA-binding XRE family transcriptional regulator
MKTIKADKKYSDKDIETLNMAINMLLNIKESKVAEKITAMTKKGWETLPLYNTIRGQRVPISNNRIFVESILQDSHFNYIGNDRFKYMTETERRTPLITIGKTFREIRKELRLTQQQVSRRLNASSAYISAIENGRQHLSINQARRIAALFGMELTISLKRKDNPPLV